MQAIKMGVQILLVLAFLDIMILGFSLAQVATGGPTGYWSPFWMAQAQFVVNPHL